LAETLKSVGLDVGTTTTQLIVSELTVQNQASGFMVPRLEITDRQILYRSPVHFTPLLGQDRVDGAAIREIVTTEYQKAGIRREDVDSGAIIITGETSRKENAAEVLRNLSDYAGDFVVATAGPDLESVLAAKGAGAVEYSAKTGKRVLHFDIGGGTSNFCLIEDGNIVRTGCLNVGGRLVKYDKDHKITYISPVLQGLTSLKVGDFI
jgi:ethanolamine utilization protein EutA